VTDTVTWSEGALEAVNGLALATGVAYAVLAARRNRLCWIAGAVSSVCAAVLAGLNKLPMQAGLQVFYVAMSVYGWWSWKRSVSEGELLVGGRNLATLSPAQVQTYRRSLGFIFQDFKLLPNSTVLENVAFVPRVLGMPLAQQQRRTFQVLKWVGLQHRMQAYPLELSGGEQQRIAIARALVNDPLIILGDEPTGNLDPDLSLEIMNLFREINARGTTVIIATHDRELIRRVGRRTLTLDHGHVVEVA